MPHLTYSESDVGSTLHQRNAKTTYIGPWKLFLFTTTNCLFMYNPSSLLHPKEKADWLHQWIWIQVCWMVGRQGLLIPLMGWEQRVHFLFVLFCWLVLFFFFFLINIEFLMDRQALGQKDVFTIQTNIHRKLLSLVCSEGSSLWRLSTAWQTIWMNASQCGRLGSRIGTGLEAGVYLTALLKGGGLEDINPGLSLSQLLWMESGFVKMLVGKAAVSQWKKTATSPIFLPASAHMPGNNSSPTADLLLCQPEIPCPEETVRSLEMRPRDAQDETPTPPPPWGTVSLE